MKSITAIALLAGLAVLAACDDYDEPRESMPAPVEAEPMAPAAEDAAEPVVEVAPAESEGAYVPPLPEDTRPSEETVQPESETLFY
jgi:hypothetical protein